MAYLRSYKLRNQEISQQNKLYISSQITNQDLKSSLLRMEADKFRVPTTLVDERIVSDFGQLLPREKKVSTTVIRDLKFKIYVYG